MESKAKHTKKPRKIMRALCISIILMAVLAVVMVYLLTYVPDIYRPLKPTGADQVNPYLTHYLAPHFHENIQLDRPFDVIVLQKGLNEIIVDENSLGWSWPYQINGVTFSAPSVVFTSEAIVLMGTVDSAGFPIVFSIIASPEFDDQGLLALNIEKIMAGAVNITGLARFIAGRIITEQLKVIERNQWLRNLEGSVQSNASFDPVFPIYNSDKAIRLTKVDLSEGKLVLGFAPAD